MEALDTKKPHAKFQAGSMAVSCNTRLANLNYSEKQQYLLQCAAMENLTIRYRERWELVSRCVRALGDTVGSACTGAHCGRRMHGPTHGQGAHARMWRTGPRTWRMADGQGRTHAADSVRWAT
ncbi:hypothetical protein GGX14DRAFT_567097 [Mycena pura]|uniref:Uncharacterized protein n=1 Tax=Mycena pura TaxID=153505 RepID=A0AAD6VFN9_9AGAR|nr:hypothetical protein GGX14DRAFT_567097 [Mycena pura]